MPIWYHLSIDLSITIFKSSENGEPTEGTGIIIIAKHRNGSLEDVKLKFVNKLAKFDNLDQFEGDMQGGFLNPNTDFESGMPNTITRKSRMDDFEDDDTYLDDGQGDAPF
jgi:hypothetical protein